MADDFRRELRDAFGGQDEAPLDDIVARGRQLRLRRRAAAAAGCSVLLLIAGALVFLQVRNTGVNVQTGGPPGQVTATSSTAPAPTPSAPAATTVTTTPTTPSVPIVGPTVGSAQLLPGGAGFVAEQNGLFWTTNLGGSWQNVTPPGVAATSLSAVTFLLDGHGWAVLATNGATATRLVGSIRIFRRSLGSGSWSSANLPDVPVVNGLGQASLSFVDPTHGWLLIDTGSHGGFNYADLFRTNDGGATWSPLTPPASGKIRFVSTTLGFIVGGEPGPNLYMTRNGGTSWAAVKLPLPPDRSSAGVGVLGTPNDTSGSLSVAVYWVDPANGDGLGFGTYISTDGGATWRMFQHTGGPNDQYVWAGVDGDPNQVVLRNGAGVAAAVARSSDNGQTFSAFSPTTGLPTPLAVSAADVSNIWAAVSVGSCASFKSNCSVSSGVFLLRRRYNVASGDAAVGLEPRVVTLLG